MGQYQYGTSGTANLILDSVYWCWLLIFNPVLYVAIVEYEQGCKSPSNDKHTEITYIPLQKLNSELCSKPQILNYQAKI